MTNKITETDSEIENMSGLKKQTRPLLPIKNSKSKV